MKQFNINTALLILTILLLIAVLIGSVLPMPSSRPPDLYPMRPKLSMIASSILIYQLDTGRYPASFLDLVQNDGSTNWDGPYLRNETFLDCWENPILLEFSKTNLVVRSAGPDKMFHTLDDCYLTKTCNPTK
jgi:hypothetical protein